MKISKAHLLPAVLLLLASLLQISVADAQRYKKRPIPAEDEGRLPADSSGRPPRLIDRMVFGGNFVAGFGSSTYVDISPLVGYRITPKWQAGLGGTYIYFRYALYDPYTQQPTGEHHSTSVYGGRVYSQYDLLHDILSKDDRLFVHGEYEALNVEYQDIYNYPYPIVRTWIGNPFIGGGYRTAIGKRSFANISVLYNLNWNNNQKKSIYGSPLQIRIGFSF